MSATKHIKDAVITALETELTGFTKLVVIKDLNDETRPFFAVETVQEKNETITAENGFYIKDKITMPLNVYLGYESSNAETGELDEISDLYSDRVQECLNALTIPNKTGSNYIITNITIKFIELYKANLISDGKGDTLLKYEIQYYKSIN